VVAVDIGRRRRGKGRGGGERVVRARGRDRSERCGDSVPHGARDLRSVDVAFNNAGISPPEDDSILTTSLEAWRRVQEVNLTSVYLCCKEAIGYMRTQGKGAIVNTARSSAVMGSATSQISYTASKGGVLALSRELGVQFAREGIRVNALCPGPVNTPLLRELFAADPERATRRLVHVPMGGSPRRRDRGGGRLPGERRRLLHHRLDVPGRRRHQRCVRDAAVSGSALLEPPVPAVLRDRVAVDRYAVPLPHNVPPYTFDCSAWRSRTSASNPRSSP